MLLLLRWAPICRGDDVDRIAEMLEVSFKEATGEVFSLKEIHNYISGRDFRDAGFRWHYNEEKQEWYLKQDEDCTVSASVYTTRHGKEGERFPHEDLRNILARAAEIVANDSPVQLPPRDPNAKRYFHKQEANYTIKLRLTGPDRSICSNEDMVEDTIALTLAALDLGTCQSTGMISSTTGKTDSLLSLHLFVDERDRGVDVIRDIMRWGMAPEGCAVWGSKTDNIDLKMHDGELRYRDEVGRHELFFMLAGMNCKQTGWLWRPWEQRLPQSIVADIKNLPGVQVADLDADDWMELKTEDGGLMRVNITKAGEEEGESKKCLLAIKELTMGVAVAICTLLETALGGGGLALMPPALVTKEPPAQPRKRRFVKVVAQELFEILEAGPYCWWNKRDGGRTPEAPSTSAEVEEGTGGKDKEG
jgi:hypothetical protein